MQLLNLLAIGFAALASSSPNPVPHQHPVSTSTSTGTPPSPTPSSTAISLTNIISIVENQAAIERETQILTTFINKVQENEPGVLVFELDLNRNRSQFLTFEVYQDQHAFDVHLKTSYLAELLATEEKEKLKRAEDQIYFLDLITRFLREPITSKV